MKTHASVWEVNFDCLIGPTHHFGGLSLGNIASTANKERLANPRAAALQGLEKMRFLTQKGFKQAILPPHERPHYETLKRLGFPCESTEALAAIYHGMPELFSSVNSSSFMWAANAATVCPKTDALDQKTHITPANLITMFHRSLEAPFAKRVFKKIFHDQNRFIVHDPLPAHDLFSDEGAANHNRLTPRHDQKGLQIFVYGKEGSMLTEKTRVFPARQSSLASAAIARLHTLDANYFLSIAQNPEAIDQGAFHNDVVCVINERLMLCHEMAFLHQQQTLKDISERYEHLYGQRPALIEISSAELPLKDAVSSYLFNSQLLSKADGKMLLFAPTECRTHERAHAVIERIVRESGIIDEAHYFDISESMANGGGPACLRLRMVLDEEELASIPQGVLFSDALYERLRTVIERYYVDRLSLEDFLDPNFHEQSLHALDAIAEALGLSSIYDFQR